MRRVQSFILHYIGGQLRIQHYRLASEPIPQRWIDLINELNEVERLQGDAKHVEPSGLQRRGRNPTAE